MTLLLRYGVLWPAIALLISAPRSALAVVEVLTPLAQFIADSDEIVVAKVQKLDATRPSTMLVVAEDLKGKTAFRELAINLKGRKPEQSAQLVDRLADDLPVVLFITHQPNQELSYCYTGGTWFQLIGHRDGKQTRWAFTDLEIYLPRTFNGSTEELRTTLADAIAGKKKPPAANPKVKPGIGPPIEKLPADKSGAEKPVGEKPAGAT
jgi:hypothetical protein